MIWGMFFLLGYHATLSKFTLTFLVRRMPLQETLDTYRYFLSEIDKLKLSYVTLLRYTTALDPVIDGK